MNIPSQSSQAISHSLNRYFVDIRKIATRKAYFRSDVYREHGEALARVSAGIEWENIHRPVDRQPGTLRITAWNIERGINLDGIIDFLRSHLHLCETDILLLTEVDIGMGRSGNRNIPKEIARALGMNYVFANSFIELTKGDEGEQNHSDENTLSLHGTAVLSRYPILMCEAPPLHYITDTFKTFEKRLGQRRGLICKIQTSTGTCDVAAVHLELKTSPRQRAYQLYALLGAMKRFGNGTQVVGGDLNTHTYNMRSRLALTGSFIYKFLFTGFEGAIRHYMHPESGFDKPVFDMLRRYGFVIEGFNDMSTGTILYDFKDKVLQEKMQKYSLPTLQEWLVRKLEPRDGKVPLRLDWLAARNAMPFDHRDPEVLPVAVIPLPDLGSRRLSDHYPVTVDLMIGEG